MPGGRSDVGGKCYVPDTTHMWLPAEVLKEKESNAGDGSKCIVAKVTLPDGSVQDRTVDLGDKQFRLALQKLQLPPELPYQNEGLGACGIEDMIGLNHLHEPAILYNVRQRFLQSCPYTYTGSICIAVNPYQWIPELYDDSVHEKYLSKPRDELPPHVYATSVASYKSMKHDKLNQSILVSGESGAGKTETTKILMNHLASIGGGLNDATIKKIIQVNPLLESFGNAKTVRNDNSSRFGKFTQLQFDKKGMLVGAKCSTYLLEKTRVIHHEEGERNYHIFYQVLASDKSLMLEDSVKYTYVGEPEDVRVDNMSDAEHFKRTETALELVGINADTQAVLFEVLSGILHLGQIVFASKSDNEEASYIPEGDAGATAVSKLLGITCTDLEKALCSRQLIMSRESVTAFMRKEQAEEARDALAKAIYSHIFDWLVTSINDSLKNDQAMVNTIGILDIFGFEHFQHNHFEQFCINYANEKLQQKFTQDVFKTVQQEYEEEGIVWSHVDFADNQDVIAIIEDRLGIISLLNDEVKRPRGSDENFVSKLASIHKEDKELVEFPQLSKTQFTIKHYAGAVTYEANGFLEKHKDALLPDLSQLMRTSSKSFVTDLFAEKEASSSKRSASSRRASSSGPSAANVGTQFKDNLNELMTNIRQTKVQYVRTIKPNKSKSPTEMDLPMVISQLRCAGVIEAIRITRVAYPDRLLLTELLDKFWILLDSSQKHLPPGKQCEQLMRGMDFTSPEQYQIGKTRIYLRYGTLDDMEAKKAGRLDGKARALQRYMKGFSHRLAYLRTLKAVIKLQSVIRCVNTMKRYTAFLNGLVKLQARWKGYTARRQAQNRKVGESATTIQRHVRGFVKRKHFRAKRKTVVHIQRFIRARIAKRMYRAALQDKRQEDNMASQLYSLQQRYADEQKRNADLFTDTDAVDTPASSPNSTGHRPRGKSTAHVWMADADGVINQLHEQVNRLRKEREEQIVANSQLKKDVERLKREKETTSANFHVKLRRYEDTIREKDKKLETMQKELDDVKKHGGSGTRRAVQKQASSAGGRKTPYRTLGAKKQVEKGASLQEHTTALKTSLTKSSSKMSDFLRESSARLSAQPTTVSSPEMEQVRKQSTPERPTTADTIPSLKERLEDMKSKYYRTDEDEGTTRPSAFDANGMRWSLTLESLPDTQLPDGWEARVSRSKGKIYYVHPGRRITQWKRPTDRPSASKSPSTDSILE